MENARNDVRDGAVKEISRTDFPKDFVFGVATSCYQIEGARSEGGKGDNIWDVFSENKDNIRDDSNGDVAVDHYHRFKEDIELMAKLGFGAYRFSISWARIFPDGLGTKVNEEGVAFYNNLINFMLEKGIQPYATLYHWDLPYNLHSSIGGWLSDKIVDYFGMYAEACFASFGDRVKHWITINEPLQTAVNGYGAGIFAPGICTDATNEPYLAAHHQLLAHAAAYKVYEEKFKARQGGEVGLVLDCEWAEAFSDKPEDEMAAARRLDFQLGWYLDPIFFGDYPETMRQRLGDHLPKLSEKDREHLRNSVDFVGLNHYTTRFISHVETPREIHFYQVQEMERNETSKSGEAIGDRAASEWLFIVPWGLKKTLNYISRKYNNPKIYVTENGMDEEDSELEKLQLHERLNDTKRVGYFKGYLAAVSQAIKDGADVRGYFAWSFLDNFEWAQGYTKRFGLVYVDYKNGLTRHPKASAIWFSHFLKGE
ncbi:beta-glucosidase 4 [Carex littledalei]|uniref:Beta-glucosidase 4 n=1 Tax=Carex littledalei TaxID=544730 RepID=A0A833V974_9POAL|nr:beta-glucosidase 4 [Carex littledalei]